MVRVGRPRMVQQGMGKSMGNRECVWVRARLPLWVDVGNGNGQNEGDLEGGDLTANDRRQIERHLVDCASCRHYRTSLEHVLGALEVAAAHLPVLPEAPSLWPMLERRIANCDTNASSRWPRAVRALAARSVRSWEDLDGERPLQQAWTRDTIRQALTGQRRQKPESKWKPGLVVRFSVAVVIIALIGIPVLRRQWKGAKSTIIANSAPLADPIIPPTAADEPLGETWDRDSNDVPTNQLADAELSRTPESPASGLDAAAAPKSSPHTRFGFDLEHGISMPPDAREAKPVY
jgi:hypothetical protein